MILVKAILRIVVGIVFGLGASMALTPAFAAFVSEKGGPNPITLMAVVLICGVLVFFAPTIRRAFGRGFLLLGASIFVLPLSTLLLSGRVASDAIEQAGQGTEGAVVVGAGLAGIAVTGLATFVGLILGSICLLIGLILVLGGRREVVVVAR